MLPGTEEKARGARSLLGVAAGRLALARLPWSLLVSFGGVGAGRRPFLVRPDSPAPFERPGGKRAPAAHGHREAGARACAAREEAAPDPLGRIEAIHDRAGTHSALGRLGPAELEGADWPKGNGRPKAAQTPSTESGGFGFGGGGFANPGIDGLPEAFDVRRPLSRKGDPRDDAAIEPANGAPKKGLAYRRAPAGLGRLRREPDPCVRRRSGAMAHSARGCMGPAEFGNAGSSPWKTLGWPSRIRRRLGRALLPGDLGGAVAVGAAAPDL